MTTLLIAVAATVAAAAVTWFFCMRPMLRKGGASSGCCPAPARNIQDEIRATRSELQRLQQAGTSALPAEPSATTPPGREA